MALVFKPWFLDDYGKTYLVKTCETVFSNLILRCSYCALFSFYCQGFYKYCGCNELMKLQWIRWLIRPSVSEGCGVLHPSFWAHRSSWPDWDLYLLLSEKGRISVKTRGTKSGKVQFSSNCKTLNLYKAPWGEWMQCQLVWSRESTTDSDTHGFSANASKVVLVEMRKNSQYFSVVFTLVVIW